MVDEKYRGRQLAKLYCLLFYLEMKLVLMLLSSFSMIESLRLLSIKLGCYKLSLDCEEKNRPFYEKFGFKHGSTLFLQLRFFD